VHSGYCKKKRTQKQVSKIEINCIFILLNLNFNVAENINPGRNSWQKVGQISCEVQSDID